MVPEPGRVRPCSGLLPSFQRCCSRAAAAAAAAAVRASLGAVVPRGPVIQRPPALTHSSGEPRANPEVHSFLQNKSAVSSRGRALRVGTRSWTQLHHPGDDSLCLKAKFR